MKNNKLGKCWAVITAAIVTITVIAFGEKVVRWDIHGLLASVTLGIIIATFSVFLWVNRQKMKEKKEGFPVKDERTKYIEGRAAHYALMIGLWFMLGLLWYSFLGMKIFDLPALETAPAMIISLLVIIGLYAVLRWYFSRKGERS